MLKLFSMQTSQSHDSQDLIQPFLSSNYEPTHSLTQLGKSDQSLFYEYALQSYPFKTLFIIDL